MKLFTLIFVLSVAVLYVKSEEISKERILKVGAECKQSTGASDADVEELLTLQDAETKEAKCLHACVMKKLQLMSDDGKINKEVTLKATEALTQGDPELQKKDFELVESCATIDLPDDLCEASQQYISCLTKGGFKVSA